MSSHKTNPILYSSQEIDNESYNDTYKIKTVALYGYDSVSNSFQPQQAAISYDYISHVAGSTTDTYTYKTGGSAGTVVSTVTVTYTDSTKSNLASVART